MRNYSHCFGVYAFTLAAIVALCGAIPAMADAASPTVVAVHTVFTDKHTYLPWEEVVVTQTVTNITDEPIAIQFGSSQTFDLIVSDGTEEVWRWSDGNGGFLAEVITGILEPGQSMGRQFIWPLVDSGDVPVVPGQYTLFGDLRGLTGVADTGQICLNDDPTQCIPYTHFMRTDTCVTGPNPLTILVVPEPSAVVLLGLGMFAWCGRRA